MNTGASMIKALWTLYRMTPAEREAVISSVILFEGGPLAAKIIDVLRGFPSREPS